jgi:hypothetical protein
MSLHAICPNCGKRNPITPWFDEGDGRMLCMACGRQFDAQDVEIQEEGDANSSGLGPQPRGSELADAVRKTSEASVAVTSPGAAPMRREVAWVGGGLLLLAVVVAAAIALARLRSPATGTSNAGGDASVAGGPAPGPPRK